MLAKVGVGHGLGPLLNNIDCNGSVSNWNGNSTGNNNGSSNVSGGEGLYQRLGNSHGSLDNGLNSNGGSWESRPDNRLKGNGGSSGGDGSREGSSSGGIAVSSVGVGESVVEIVVDSGEGVSVSIERESSSGKARVGAQGVGESTSKRGSEKLWVRFGRPLGNTGADELTESTASFGSAIDSRNNGLQWLNSGDAKVLAIRLNNLGSIGRDCSDRGNWKCSSERSNGSRESPHGRDNGCSASDKGSSRGDHGSTGSIVKTVVEVSVEVAVKVAVDTVKGEREIREGRDGGSVREKNLGVGFRSSGTDAGGENYDLNIV